MGSDNESYSSGSESGGGSGSGIKIKKDKKVKKDKKDKKDKDKDSDKKEKDKKDKDKDSEKKDKDKKDKDKDKKDKDKGDKKDKDKDDKKDKDKDDKKDKDKDDKKDKDKDKKDKDVEKPSDSGKAQKHYELTGVVQPPAMSGNYGQGEAASYYNSGPQGGLRDHGQQAPFMPPYPPPAIPDFSRAPPPPFPTHNHPYNEQYQQQQQQQQHGGGAPGFPSASVGDRSLDQHRDQPQQSARPPPPPSGYRIPLGQGTPFPQSAQAGPPPFREPGGEPVFVGSALLENPSSVHPCKITVGDHPICRVAYGGSELEHHGRFDLLPIDANTMEWLPTRDGVIPSGRRPVEGGYEEHGARLFHAYADIDGNAVPGKTGEHLRGANVSYGGGEHNVTHAYFILCWR